MALKRVATQLVDETHAEVLARARAMELSVSEYLQELIVADLRRQSSRGAEVGHTQSSVPAAGDNTEVLALLIRLGETLHATRASLLNFCLVYCRVASGEFDPRSFNWRQFAEDYLVVKEQKRP